MQKSIVQAILSTGAVDALRGPKRNLMELRAWERRRFAAPSPQFVKRQVIVRHGMPNATWVETGTYLGDTTNHLSKSAKFVYSIEPEPTLYANAAKRFSKKKNVEILHGLSEDLFPSLLERLDGNLNVWLDGHASGGITFKASKDTPIVDELEAIVKHRRRFGSIVVLVDDVRCFDPTNPEFDSYPPLDFLVDWARTNGFRWSIEHDIFVAKLDTKR